MKIVLFLISFLMFYSSFSQFQGIVKYIGSVDTSNIEKKIDSLDKVKKDKVVLKDALYKVLSDTKSINYTLEFNSNESKFYKETSELEVKNVSFNLTEILGGKGLFYCKLKDRELLTQMEAYGEDFLISKNIDSLKWKLLNISKKIGKYNCYKATTQERVVNSKGIFFKEVVAWYTLDIPVSFGPKNFNNLPGLILQLKIDKFLFKAINISLKDDP
ncbi:MAG: GLPGLI family protein, partial [Flavobacteriaceae bacterium]